MRAFDPLHFGLYTYANNSPVVLIDPDGRMPTASPGAEGASGYGYPQPQPPPPVYAPPPPVLPPRTGPRPTEAPRGEAPKSTPVGESPPTGTVRLPPVVTWTGIIALILAAVTGDTPEDEKPIAKESQESDPVHTGENSAGKVYTNRHGQLTNGKYTLDAKAMAPHTTGSLASGKSQFLHGINERELVLDAASFADQAGLWVGNKAKVVFDSPVGVHAGTGAKTNVINIYRNRNGFVHGAPARPRP